MDLRQLQRLRSEVTKLDSMLAKTPPDRVIDRISLEGRKTQVLEELARFQDQTTDVHPTLLTFRGKPVKGEHGILVDFGAQIIDAFNAAIEAMGASSTQELGSRGPIPGGANHRLMITGVARGSFGFQLERASDQLLLVPDSDPVAVAVHRVKTVMEATLLSDDELTATLVDTDRRALNGIRKFLDTLVEHEATCAIESNLEEFRFTDVDQVRRSAGRLQEDNVHERDVILTGKFIGFLPESREAEFVVSGIHDEDECFLGEIVGSVVKAKVDQSVGEANTINDSLETDTTIAALSRRVGEGKPTFAIKGFGNFLF